MEKEKIFDIAISLGTFLIDNGVDNVNDVFNVIGSFISQTTYMLVAEHPEINPEENTAAWLDHLKDDILSKANDVREIGLPPELKPN